ncbi:MAG: hypothetical protein ACRDQZ_13260 [Mycobacteriales bacterium]
MPGDLGRSLVEADRCRAVYDFRRLNGWSQLRAAIWYGCSERSWRRYEAGDRPVPLPLLNRIRERNRGRRQPALAVS